MTAASARPGQSAGVGENARPDGAIPDDDAGDLEAADGAPGPPIRIIINADWCKGCYICVSVCPREVLAIDRERWTGSHHPIVVAAIERCALCRNCELLCPDLAIEVLADE